MTDYVSDQSLAAYLEDKQMGAAAQIHTIHTPEHPRPPRRIRARKLFEPELVRGP